MPHAHREAFGPRSRRNLLRVAFGVSALDLNAATVKELEELPGVGPTTAKAIVDFRTKSGRFRRINDLLVIRGISEAKLAKIRPYVTIGPPAKKQPLQPQPAATTPPRSPQ